MYIFPFIITIITPIIIIFAIIVIFTHIIINNNNDNSNNCIIYLFIIYLYDNLWSPLFSQNHPLVKSATVESSFIIHWRVCAVNPILFRNIMVDVATKPLY